MTKKLQRCLQEPIPEIYDAARYLDAAVSAHLTGKPHLAEELIYLANMPIIREWIESIWGIEGLYTKLTRRLGEPEMILKENRDLIRMPNKQGEKALLNRDGYHCRFCGVPLIRKEVRQAIKKLYPGALPWGRKNLEQHVAFQAMWLQYDHVLPHARGGETSLDNMVITCAPCNYGRMNFMLEEVDLAYPSEPISSTWDGLERILLI